MPVFATSTGNVTVNNWGYQLHAPNGLNATALANETHDLIVMDFSSDGTGANSFSSAQISAIKDGPGGRTVAVAYISIGEATEFRDLWDASWTSNGLASGTLTASAPSWLGPTNPEWPEGRKVRYWDSDWQDKIFNDAGTGWLDKIVAQGFDAAYLDIVGAYYYWAVDVPASERQTGDPAAGDEKDAAQRMIDFIVDLTAHARQTNPYFFVIPQNGEFILDALEGTDPVRKAAYLDAVGAIGVEDIYNPGNLDENNPFSPDAERISVLQNDFLGNGIPVFSVDYVNTSSLVTSFENQAAADGFIAYAAPDRDLNVMGPEIGAGPGAATSGDDNLTGTTGADSINGLAGNDIIEGLAGADFLDGGPDTDTLSYQNSGAAVTVNLQLDTASGGDAAGDIISNFENVEGSAFDDDIRGTTGVNTLNGNDGADTIRGDSGDDTINGGAGNDQLYGERDNDTINGGAGNDRIHGGNLDDTINGDAGADTLIGDAGSDTIHGGTGNDRIYGGSGADFLFGDDGHDLLAGSAADDELTGGAGNDRLLGAGGADTFIFAPGSGADRIFNFEDNIDTIRISASYGFATPADVIAATSASGVNALITLSSGNSINVVNWLQGGTHTITDLENDIVIL